MTIATLVAFLLVAAQFIADQPSPAPTVGPADCSAISTAEAGRVLGFDVQPPDEISRAGGICFYPSRDVSQDGSLSFAVVTPDRLPQRRNFFRAYSRRCAPAAKGTLNEIACRQFLKLAVAETIDDYFAARTGAGDASPVPGLGESAVASGTALYVRRAQLVLEVSVLRGGDFDLARSEKLAAEVLAHTR